MFFEEHFSDEVSDLLSDYREENEEWMEENMEKTLELVMVGYAAGADSVRNELENVNKFANQEVERAKQRLE